MKRQQFALGCLGIGLAFTILAFFGSNDGNFEERVLSALGGGIGGLMVSLLFGVIVWWVIRSIRGVSKAPEIKGFLLKVSAVLCAIYIILTITGIIKT